MPPTKRQRAAEEEKEPATRARCKRQRAARSTRFPLLDLSDDCFSAMASWLGLNSLAALSCACSQLHQRLLTVDKRLPASHQLLKRMRLSAVQLKCAQMLNLQGGQLQGTDCTPGELSTLCMLLEANRAPSLRELRLSSNGICCTGVSALVAALEASGALGQGGLRVLNLRFNEIEEPGLLTLAAAVQRARGDLQRFYLDGNPGLRSTKACDALRAAVKHLPAPCDLFGV